MTRARMPRPHEVAAARRDPRLLRAVSEQELDPAWRTRGLCQSVDPETFFPAPSEPADAAVALCRTCVVQGPCLAWALEVGDCHGVWGATTPRERRAMLVAWRSHQQRRDAAAAATAEPEPAELGRLGPTTVTDPVQVRERVEAAAMRDSTAVLDHVDREVTEALRDERAARRRALSIIPVQHPRAELAGRAAGPAGAFA